jgi:hypothetical protein
MEVKSNNDIPGFDKYFSLPISTLIGLSYRDNRVTNGILFTSSNFVFCDLKLVEI